jgi:hypothetical protein
LAYHDEFLNRISRLSQDVRFKLVLSWSDGAVGKSVVATMYRGAEGRGVLLTMGTIDGHVLRLQEKGT